LRPRGVLGAEEGSMVVGGGGGDGVVVGFSGAWEVSCC